MVWSLVLPPSPQKFARSAVCPPGQFRVDGGRHSGGVVKFLLPLEEMKAVHLYFGKN
jgi:hypothetical protein